MSDLLNTGAIGALVRRLTDHFGPEQVWLFGSRATGRARPDSDWDIVVVLDDEADEQDLDLRAAHRLFRGSGIGADIVPIRQSDFAEDRAIPGTLSYEVARSGVLLHERGQTDRKPALAGL